MITFDFIIIKVMQNIIALFKFGYCEILATNFIAYHIFLMKIKLTKRTKRIMKCSLNI